MNASTGVQYMDAWPLNEAVEGTAGVGVVTATTCPQFKVGCFVGAEFGWPWKKFFAANAAKHSLRLSLRMVRILITSRANSQSGSFSLQFLPH